MADLSIQYDQMQQTSQKFQSAQEQTSQLLSSLNSTVSGLQQSWQGQAKSRFDQAWPTYQKEVQNLAQLLGEVSKELTQVSTRLREADQQASGQINAKA